MSNDYGVQIENYDYARVHSTSLLNGYIKDTIFVEERVRSIGVIIHK